MNEELLESPTVNRLPARSEYGLPKHPDVNAKILDGILLYRYHLISVENGAVAFILHQFKSVFKLLDALMDQNNQELMRLLSVSRMFQSSIPIKESKDVAIPLTTRTIMEAKKPGNKSPLSPQGIKTIVDYIVGQLHPRINSSISVIAQMVSQVVLQVADAEPKIVSDIINNVLPVGVKKTTEPPVDRLAKIVANGTKHEGAMQVRYQKVLKKIENRMAIGLMQGKGIKMIAQDIRGMLNREMAGGAAMLARTEIQRAAAASQKELYGHNKDIIKAEVWMATFDSDVCLQCGNLDGQRFAIGHGPQPIDDTHPNCRCLRSPVIKSWRELGIDIDDAPIGVRASMGGTVPGRLTFKGWFSNQSDKVKKEILGRSRFGMYQSGKLELKDFATNTRILSVKQLKRRYKIK